MTPDEAFDGIMEHVGRWLDNGAAEEMSSPRQVCATRLYEAVMEWRARVRGQSFLQQVAERSQAASPKGNP